MKHKWIRKLLVFILFVVMTSMLITVDRETSVMNNRQPWTELKVTRVDKEYFNITFLGYSQNFKAAPVEKIWASFFHFK
jgi:hypothetical protein